MRHAPIRCDEDAPPMCPEEAEELRQLFARSSRRPYPRPPAPPPPSKKTLAETIAECRATYERMQARGPRVVLVRTYGPPRTPNDVLTSEPTTMHADTRSRAGG